MKREYVTPLVDIASVAVQPLLAGSGGINSSKDDIGYGGVDEDGSQVPVARRPRTDWEDDDAE